MVKEENQQVEINESNLNIVIENLKKHKYIDRKKRLKTILINGKLCTIVGEYQDKNRKFISIVHENRNSNFINDLYVLEGKRIFKANEDAYKQYNECKMIKKYKRKKEDEI